MVEKGKHISKKKLDFASILQRGTVKSEKPTFPNYFFMAMTCVEE
jgi:hypothetical protein